MIHVVLAILFTPFISTATDVAVASIDVFAAVAAAISDRSSIEKEKKKKSKSRLKIVTLIKVMQWHNK